MLIWKCSCVAYLDVDQFFFSCHLSSLFLNYVLHGDLVSQPSVKLYMKRMAAINPEIKAADT